MGSDTSAMGTAFATKLVAEQSRKVKFMYRESPSGPDDSGWHFFCGEEPQEYVDDPNNTGTYPVSLIVQIDPSVASESYLKSDLFSNDVVGEIGPLLDADPEIRIYDAH